MHISSISSLELAGSSETMTIWISRVPTSMQLNNSRRKNISEMLFWNPLYRFLTASESCIVILLIARTKMNYSPLVCCKIQISELKLLKSLETSWAKIKRERNSTLKSYLSWDFSNAWLLLLKISTSRVRRRLLPRILSIFREITGKKEKSLCKTFSDLFNFLDTTLLQKNSLIFFFCQKNSKM